MSSLWKHPRSSFLTACFCARIGSRLVQLKKSTGTRDKTAATKIAIALEEAGQGRLEADQAKAFLTTVRDLRARRAAQRALNDVLRRVTGRGLETRTVRGFVNEWLELGRNEVAPSTRLKYQQTARIFLESLGGKAEQDLDALTRADLAAFRDAQARRVSPATVNGSLKVVRVLLAKAEQDGLVLRNEARFVKLLKNPKRDTRQSRRAFTLPEVRRILQVCDDEWRSLIIFGLYTGQRLGDLASLTWQNLDLAAGELRLVTAKTGRAVVIPLAAPLRRHVETLPAGDDPKQPLHPRAHGLASRQGRVSMLSAGFSEILASAGLAKARTHQATDETRKGRAARRETTELSFHSLRHTAVTWLKNAGVSDAVAQDLVGHESAEVSRLYTHIDDTAKRNAVNRLPEIDDGWAAEQSTAGRGNS